MRLSILRWALLSTTLAIILYSFENSPGLASEMREKILFNFLVLLTFTYLYLNQF